MKPLKLFLVGLLLVGFAIGLAVLQDGFDSLSSAFLGLVAIVSALAMVIFAPRTRTPA